MILGHDPKRNLLSSVVVKALRDCQALSPYSSKLLTMVRKFLFLFAALAVVFLVLIARLVPPARTGRSLDQPAMASPNGVPAPAASFSDADFAKHVEQLKKKLPSSNFTIVIQPPFVVIGDEPAQDVRDHSTNTVKWAVDKLKQDYFTKDPKEILDIWLFKDAVSYEKNVLALFGEKPGTPYGYYSSAHKSLIMNISTGGGTLVHELVHPFVEANFPACPPWLNEGLGSLYEQSGEVDGHIHGYTNWRLPGLRRAILAGKVPSFKLLTSLDARAFYDQDIGSNYGQARYLCYYLQQRGLLIKFYREFLARQKTDPTGYRSLQKTLGTVDMPAFKRKWEKYVLSLKQGFEVDSLPSGRN
jgi:hypothetical protein